MGVTCVRSRTAVCGGVVSVRLRGHVHLFRLSVVFWKACYPDREHVFTRWKRRLTSNHPAGSRRWRVIEVKRTQTSVFLFCFCVQHCVCYTPVPAHSLLSVILTSCRLSSVPKASTHFQRADGKGRKRGNSDVYSDFKQILLYVWSRSSISVIILPSWAVY